MYDQRTYGGARADVASKFGMDWAKRILKRHKAGLPVNRDELRLAEAIVKGGK